MTKKLHLLILVVYFSLLKGQQFQVSNKCFDGRKSMYSQDEPVSFTQSATNQIAHWLSERALCATAVGLKPVTGG